jgi:hypothetical protein
MRVIHWRGDSAFTSLFVRDNQMLAPLAILGGLQLCRLEAGGPMSRRAILAAPFWRGYCPPLNTPAQH